LPDRFSIVTTIAQYAFRTMARTSSLWLQAWGGVNQCKGLLRVVTVGTGQLNGERNPATIADQMALTAQLGPISRVRSRLSPPKTARIELPSTTAREQSISRATRQPVQQKEMDQSPDACLLPFT
jgi:hypothetical protein